MAAGYMAKMFVTKNNIVEENSLSNKKWISSMFIHTAFDK